MISKKKKIFILAGMVALLVATGVLNIYLNKNAATDVLGGGGVVYTSFFDGFKADRKATRDQTILYLDAIIDNSATGSAELAQAQSAKIDIVAHMTIESTLEGLIRALGYDQVVVSSTNEKVTIIMKIEDLTDTEIAQILYVTLSETGRTASDVRIIPVS